MSKPVPGHFVMLFGKYKGTKFDEVPADYLLYMYDNGYLQGEIKGYVIQNEEFLRTQAANDKKGIL